MKLFALFVLAFLVLSVQGEYFIEDEISLVLPDDEAEEDIGEVSQFDDDEERR